jgi:hypothetical protein
MTPVMRRQKERRALPLARLDLAHASMSAGPHRNVLADYQRIALRGNTPQYLHISINVL